MHSKFNFYSILIFFLVIALSYGSWLWFFCRIYVPPGYMAVLIAKVGEELPPNQILAKKGQKGIQEEVLGEGRYFFNPFIYEHKIHPLVTIPPGKIGVVTSKVGKDLPPGEFLAERGEKGIWKEVLGPGKYRLNPYAYDITIEDAVSIPIGYVGVLTSLSGKQAPPGQFAGKGEKGVCKDILQPGFYYINPRAYKVDILEVGVNQVTLRVHGGQMITKAKRQVQNVIMEELQEKMLETQMRQRADYLADYSQAKLKEASMAEDKKAITRKIIPQREKEKQQVEPDKGSIASSAGVFDLMEYVEFPSRDGFNIRLDMTVEFEILPADIAWIFSQYGDLPIVVDKIILPQISSISRNKGSEYRARDFIMGEAREKFQNELTATLKRRLAERKIIVYNALIRHVEVPTEILDPIQKTSIAKERDLTNQEKQNTAKKQAELNTELALIDQKKEQVLQETEKMKAEIRAQQEKEVAMIKGMKEQKVAEIGQETAKVLADIERVLGIAKANATKIIESEKAKGLEMKIKVFGDPHDYNLLRFAEMLNPTLKIQIIHTGPGTLWTDLRQASLGELGGAILLKEDEKKTK